MRELTKMMASEGCALVIRAMNEVWNSGCGPNNVCRVP